MDSANCIRRVKCTRQLWYGRRKQRCIPPKVGARYDPILPSVSGETIDVCILGDLHIQEDQLGAYDEAKNDFLCAVANGPADAAVVVQLGDVGTGPSSGSRAAFAAACAFLGAFRLPASAITGNHDLEGTDFDTDAANLAAWQDEFCQSHFWLRDVGPCLLVGLSTTRYRDNTLSHHEVHVDAEQLEWLEGVLREVQTEKPVVIFTHAPPMGCGLKVIHDLHIKNRCAWLNHSAPDAGAFIELVAAYAPRVRAWFSGHFHLSHNYADSITAAHGCAFVQTGVIGPHCCRDGFRQSRLLRVSSRSCQVYTLDHEDSGRLRLDAAFDWADPRDPVSSVPDDEIVCDASAGYVCARDACSALWRDDVRWWTVAADVLLAAQDGRLLEYDIATFAPTGCVTLDTRGCRVVLRGAGGEDVSDEAGVGDGARVAKIELVDEDGGVAECFPRNQWGSFFTVFQMNKWKEKRRQLADGSAQQETVMT